jgi:lysozyme
MADAAPKPAKGGAMAALIALVGVGTAAIIVPETQHWEGKRNKAYLDIAGIPTICFGDTANVRMGQVASDAECDERLAQQLLNHARPVLACVPALARPERQQQRAASIVLAYNIGTTGFCKSTAAQRFRAGDWRGGCDAFLRWNKARVGGVLLWGVLKVCGLVGLFGDDFSALFGTVPSAWSAATASEAVSSPASSCAETSANTAERSSGSGDPPRTS